MRKIIKNKFYFISVFIMTFSLIFLNLGIAEFENRNNSVLNNQNKLFVGGFGPGNFSSIQNAINNAKPNDIIFVYNGTYFENLLIEVPLLLIGESRDSTIINGGNTGDIPCIKILSEDVTIDGFKIIWSDWEFHESGINIQSEYVTIRNNNISNHDKGILMNYPVKNCEIYNNIFFNNHESILSKNQGCECVSIQNNTFVSSSFGMLLMNSKNNVISHNVFYCHMYAILLKNSNDNIFFENTIKDNSRGIYLIDGCLNNVIYNNNIIGNIQQVNDEGKNIWDLGKLKGGNFWEDYSGIDTDNDSFGDEPYLINGGRNIDKYPLIQKYQWEKNSIKVNIEKVDECFINQEIEFSLKIKGGMQPYSILWNFGDDSLSTLQNPNHCYNKSGIFNISISVLDPYERSFIENFTIKVYDEDNNPPQIIIFSPISGIYFNNVSILSLTSCSYALIIGSLPINIKITDNETYVDKTTISIKNNNDKTIKYLESTDTIIDEIVKFDKIGFYLLIIESFDFSRNKAIEKINFFHI